MNPSPETLLAALDAPVQIAAIPPECARPSLQPACEPQEGLLGVCSRSDHVRMSGLVQSWKIAGGVIVLAFALGAVGLWAWTFTEFVRLLLETIPQPPILLLLETVEL